MSYSDTILIICVAVVLGHLLLIGRGPAWVAVSDNKNTQPIANPYGFMLLTATGEMHHGELCYPDSDGQLQFLMQADDVTYLSSDAEENELRVVAYLSLDLPKPPHINELV